MKTKRILKLLTLGIIGVVAVSCSSEDEYFANGSETENVQTKVSEIERMANDFGLSVTVNAQALEKAGCKVNMDSLESFFRSMAAINGTYTLASKSDGLAEQKPKATRARTRSAQNESYDLGGYEEPGFLRGYCILHYSIDKDGNYYGVSVDADIQGYAMTGVSYGDVDAYVDGNNVIRISGTVTYEYEDFDAFPYDDDDLVVLKYQVEGTFSDGSGSVTWRSIPQWNF